MKRFFCLSVFVFCILLLSAGLSIVQAADVNWEKAIQAEMPEMGLAVATLYGESTLRLSEFCHLAAIQVNQKKMKGMSTEDISDMLKKSREECIQHFRYSSRLN